jgi:hypothetical protein
MNGVMGFKTDGTQRMVKIIRTYALHFILFLAFLFLTASQVPAQQPGLDDYAVYSCIIKNEIPDTIQSIGLLKNGIAGKEVNEYTQNLVLALRSNNYNSLQHLYSWTESENGERPTVIDTTMHQHILDFCSYPSNAFELSEKFEIPCKAIMLERYPIKTNSSHEDWDHFYKKFPGSGGIFAFSRVLYYQENRSTAIVYFWHRRYDLNGHGALVILKKQNEGWKIQYKTYLWWN